MMNVFWLSPSFTKSMRLAFAAMVFAALFLTSPGVILADYDFSQVEPETPLTAEDFVNAGVVERPKGSDRLGHALLHHNDELLVSALDQNYLYEDPEATGYINIYKESEGGLELHQVLKPEGVLFDDNPPDTTYRYNTRSFGHKLAASGDTLVVYVEITRVYAWNTAESPRPQYPESALIVYQKNKSTDSWEQKTILNPPDWVEENRTTLFNSFNVFAAQFSLSKSGTSLVATSSNSSYSPYRLGHERIYTYESVNGDWSNITLPTGFIDLGGAEERYGSNRRIDENKIVITGDYLFHLDDPNNIKSLLVFKKNSTGVYELQQTLSEDQIPVNTAQGESSPRFVDNYNLLAIHNDKLFIQVLLKRPNAQGSGTESKYALYVYDIPLSNEQLDLSNPSDIIYTKSSGAVQNVAFYEDDIYMSTSGKWINDNNSYGNTGVVEHFALNDGKYRFVKAIMPDDYHRSIFAFGNSVAATENNVYIGAPESAGVQTEPDYVGNLYEYTNYPYIGSLHKLGTETITVAVDVGLGGNAGLSPVGLLCRSTRTCEFEFSKNSIINPIIEPFSGYEIDEISPECSDAAFRLQEDTTCSFTFKEIPKASLNITVEGEGRVQSDPSGIYCPSSRCSWDYYLNTEVSLSAYPDYYSNHELVSITGDCDESGLVVMDDDKSCTYTFREIGTGPTEHQLSVQVIGNGAAATNPTGFTCGADETCSANFTADSTVTLLTNADQGYRLASIDGDCLAGGSVIMDAAKSCTVTFEEEIIEPTQHTLNLNINGQGSVTSDIAGIDCGDDCSEDYAENTEVVLTANPAEGYQFDGFTGEGCDSGTIMMNQARSCTASFSEVVPNVFLLTVNVTGEGTVTSEPAGIDCGEDCSESHDMGTEVTLTASSSEGFQFDGFSEEDCTTGIFTMNKDTTCTANFSAIPPQSFVLNVEVTQNSDQLVTIIDNDASPLNCTGPLCTASYVNDSSVSLVPTVAEGFAANGFGGDCSASGEVTIDSDKTCSLSIIAIDTEAPTTTLSFENAVTVGPPPDKNDPNPILSYAPGLTMVLTADDEDAFITYHVNGSGDIIYNEPVVFDQVGSYNIVFYAEDIEGNVETQQRFDFDIEEQTEPPVQTGYQWRLDENNGTTANDNVGDNDGAIDGATWNNGLEFDGYDDYINLGENITIESETVTIAAWFNSKDLDNCVNSDCRIISRSKSTNNSDHDFMLSTIREDGKNLARFRLSVNGSTEKLVADSGQLLNNTWYHIAGVYNGSEMKLYLDGEEVGSVAVSGEINNREGISTWIGGNPDGKRSRPFDGKIADVRIIDSALSLNEIIGLMNQASMLDIDSDEDGVVDMLDNCPQVNNPNQEDSCEVQFSWKLNGEDQNLDAQGATQENDYHLFDGKDDYINLGKNINIEGEAFSLSSWFNSSDYENCINSDCRIISKAKGASRNDHWYMVSTIEKNNQINLRFRLKLDGETEELIALDAPLLNNTWYNAIVTYNGSEMKIFLNGEEVATKSASGSINTSLTHETWIGGNPNGKTSRPFKGKISDIRMFDKALTENEIEEVISDSSITTKDADDDGVADYIDNCPNTPNPNQDDICQPISLQHYWPLNDSTGETAADQAGNIDGEIKGAQWGSPILSFDGEDDYVNLGDDIAFSGDKATFAAWFNSEDLKNCSSWDCRILSNASGTSKSSHNFMISTIKRNGKTRLRFRLKTKGWVKELKADKGDLQENTWYHVAGVYDGRKMRIYLDGNQVASGSKSGDIDFSHIVETWIGGNPDSPTSRPWKGKISDVRIYNEALTSGEIQEMMEEAENLQ